VFRRGFKTWCETIAAQKRKALKLAESAPLCAWKLAKHLGVFVRTPHEIAGLPSQSRDRLLVENSDAWSALTVAAAKGHLIVVNSAHSRRRQSSDLMHELAHIIIGHEPSWASETDDGLMILSSFDRDKEDEADWLSGVLLLPREALLQIRKRQLDNAAACDEYTCSQDMLTYRFRVSGVDIQMQRMRSSGKKLS
jgi:hypothetical protein